MAWFKRFLRSQPVRVEFAVPQTPHAVSHPWAFVPGHLLEMAFLSSCTWREGVSLTRPCHPPRPRSGVASARPQVELNIRVCPLVCSLCPEHSRHATAFDTPWDSRCFHGWPLGWEERGTSCASVPVLSSCRSVSSKRRRWLSPALDVPCG